MSRSLTASRSLFNRTLSTSRSLLARDNVEQTSTVDIPQSNSIDTTIPHARFMAFGGQYVLLVNMGNVDGKSVMQWKDSVPLVLKVTTNTLDASITQFAKIMIDVLVVPIQDTNSTFTSAADIIRTLLTAKKLPLLTTI